MNTVKASILELCSESEHGAWEFWLKKPEQRTSQDAEDIINAILELVNEKKIYAMEEVAVNDHSYTETTLDKNRLREQIIASMKPNNIPEDTNLYWFIATDAGKEEDIKLRSK